VIATGGSLVVEPASYEFLRTHCYTVWLRATPEEHMERVIAQGDLRPVRGREHAMAELRTILAQRDRLYRLADATVDTAGQPSSTASPRSRRWRRRPERTARRRCAAAHRAGGRGPSRRAAPTG
jgi:XRE family aerobic/anaerobic benzoate catabolism transcriptional regulator